MVSHSYSETMTGHCEITLRRDCVGFFIHVIMKEMVMLLYPPGIAGIAIKNMYNFIL